MNTKQALAVWLARKRPKVSSWLLPICILGVTFTSGYLVKNSEERQFEVRLEDQRKAMSNQYSVQLASIEGLQLERMKERDRRLEDQLARIDEQHQMILDLQKAVGIVIDKQKVQIRAHDTELKVLKRTEDAATKAAIGVTLKDKQDINRIVGSSK